MGEYGGRLFIVMELLKGRDLAEVIGDRALPVERAVDLAIQLADGLAAVHAANIVHRDLKPANIFVKSSGSLKICDFGVVRDNNGYGGDPTFIGTLPYMAPERLVPGDKRVAPASDLWAAGCIVYICSPASIPSPPGLATPVSCSARSLAAIPRRHTNSTGKFPLPERHRHSPSGQGCIEAAYGGTA